MCPPQGWGTTRWRKKGWVSLSSGWQQRNLSLKLHLAQFKRSRSKATSQGNPDGAPTIRCLVSRSLFLGENCQVNCCRTKILQTSQGRWSINSGSIISLNVLGLKWNHREACSCKSNCSWTNCVLFLCSVGYPDLVVFAMVQTATSAWHPARETCAPKKGDHWSLKCAFLEYI